MEYSNSIKALLLDIGNDNAISTSVLKWEYLKFNVRKCSIAFSKKLEKGRRAEETNLVKELMELYSKVAWTELVTCSPNWM